MPKPPQLVPIVFSRPTDADGAISQRFKRNGLRRFAHIADNLGDDGRARGFDSTAVNCAGCGAANSRGLCFNGDGTRIQQQRDQVGLADFAVADGGIRLCCVIVGEHNCTPGVGPQTVQNRRKVSVARQDDEFIEERVVRR